MSVKISRFPILTHIKAKMTTANRIAEAGLVTDLPPDLNVESFFNPQNGIENYALNLHFAWVEGVDRTPSEVSECLRVAGYVRADATIGVALVRQHVHVLPHILDGDNEFALLGELSVTDGGVFYATIHQGENYARVLGTRSVHDQFPSTLPVLVFKKS